MHLKQSLFILLMSLLSFSCFGTTTESAKKIGVINRLIDTTTVAYIERSPFSGISTEMKKIDTKNWGVQQELITSITDSLNKSGKYKVTKTFNSTHKINFGDLLKELLLYDDINEAPQYLSRLYQEPQLSDIDQILIISPKEGIIPGSTNASSGNGGLLGAALDSALAYALSKRYNQNGVYSYSSGGLWAGVSVRYILIDLKSKQVLSQKYFTKREKIPYLSKLSKDERKQILDFAIASNTTPQDIVKLKKLIMETDFISANKDEVVKIHLKGINDDGEEDEDHSSIIKTLFVENRLKLNNIPTNFSAKNSIFDNKIEEAQKTIVMDLAYALTTGLKEELEKRRKKLAQEAAEAKLNADFGDSEE